MKQIQLSCFNQDEKNATSSFHVDVTNEKNIYMEKCQWLATIFQTSGAIK